MKPHANTIKVSWKHHESNGSVYTTMVVLNHHGITMEKNMGVITEAPQEAPLTNDGSSMGEPLKHHENPICPMEAPWKHHESPTETPRKSHQYG